MQNAGRIGKGHEPNSGFSARRTTDRFFGNALRLKQQGPPAALEDRARRFYSTFSAIVAQDSIVSDTDQSRRQDMEGARTGVDDPQLIAPPSFRSF